MNKAILSKPALSPFVAVAFLVIAVTGVLLFFHVKSGPIMVLHEVFGLAFVVVGAWHVLLNLRPLLSYFRLRTAWVSLGIAVIVTAVLYGMGTQHEGNHGPRGPRPPLAAAE